VAVFPLFPVPLGVYNLGEVHNRQDLQLVDATLRAQQADSVGAQKSQVGGWHSNHLIDFDPAFEELCALVENYTKEYTTECGLSTEVSVTNCWANINQKGSYNMMHHHNGSALGGVYYPAQSLVNGEPTFNYSEGNPVRPGSWGDNGGELTIQSPHYSLYNGLPSGKMGAYTISHYHVNPTAGLLLLFPAYLIHGVVPVMDDSTRISISFSFRHD
jgi:hypothetical protein